MPDPVEWLLAMLAAAGSSAALAAAFGRRWRTSPARTNAAGILACGVGSVLGYGALKLCPAWPPAVALDRLLVIVLPSTIVVELLAAIPQAPRRLATALRIGLALALARVLLHDSVYLAVGDESSDSAIHRTACLVLGGIGIAGYWYLMLLLDRRGAGCSLPLALSLAIACGGAAILLAGYVRGGEAALPLAAAIAGAALAPAAQRLPSTREGLIGMGVIGLAGLLIVGHYFGRLTAGRALAVFLAPLLWWGADLPVFRRRKSWQLAAVRLLFVAIPLIAVLLLAKRDFDREMGPLFGEPRPASLQAPAHWRATLPSLLSFRCRDQLAELDLATAAGKPPTNLRR